LARRRVLSVGEEDGGVAGALLAQVMADGVGERSAWDHRKGEMLNARLREKARNGTR